MANTQDRRTSAAIEKAAAAEVGISDFRRETRSFPVLSRARLSVGDTDELCSAIMFDFFAGKIDSGQVAVLLGNIDRMLKREDQVLEREQMTLQAELRKQTAQRIAARHAALIAESHDLRLHKIADASA